MKTYFDSIDYLGVYNDLTGELIVTNVILETQVSKYYTTKYTAKRGFGRIVRKMNAQLTCKYEKYLSQRETL